MYELTLFSVFPRISGKKGLLYLYDLVKQTKFPQNCKSFPWPGFWKFGMSMYIDDVAFKYKCNPFRWTIGLRKPIQGLGINKAKKGKKGKKQVRFYVGILYTKAVTKELFFTNLPSALWILNVIVTLLL